MLKEGYQSMGEDFDIHVSIHDSYKYANLRMIPPADSSPYMYFDWVLGAWLATWLLSISTTTKAPVSFKLNRSFICPDYIFEVVLKVLMSPLESFHLVDITNELTIRCPMEIPSQGSSIPQYCAQ